MSHCTVCDNVPITDLKALAAACAAIGLEFVEGQSEWRWFGKHVGDYAIPKGFTEDDLGKCQHAIRVPGNSKAYEIGVCQRRDGKPGYLLMYDFWAGGNGLMAVAGKDCTNVVKSYSTKVAEAQLNQLKRQGFRVRQTVNAQGKTQLIAERR